MVKNKIFETEAGFKKSYTPSKNVNLNLAGKRGRYYVELEPNTTPYSQKPYFKDTSTSYPNYLTDEKGKIKSFNSKKEAEVYAKDWSKKNQNNIERYEKDFKVISEQEKEKW